MKFDYLTDMKVDNLPSGRTYHTPDGSYPSITTVLGKTANNIWLERWKESVGPEQAARISKEATDRGTLVHDFAERHFNGESIDLSSQTADVIQMTQDLITSVETGIEDIWGQEQILWSNKYRYAGRSDMIGVWKGTPSIIDFKTAKKRKSSSQIRDYYLQCCAYAVAHNELYGTGIRHGVIVITVDGDKPQIFEKELPPFLYELKNRRKAFEVFETDI